MCVCCVLICRCGLLTHLAPKRNYNYTARTCSTGAHMATARNSCTGALSGAAPLRMRRTRPPSFCLIALNTIASHSGEACVSTRVFVCDKSGHSAGRPVEFLQPSGITKNVHMLQRGQHTPLRPTLSCFQPAIMYAFLRARHRLQGGESEVCDSALACYALRGVGCERRFETQL